MTGESEPGTEIRDSEEPCAGCRPLKADKECRARICAIFRTFFDVRFGRRSTPVCRKDSDEVFGGCLVCVLAGLSRKEEKDLQRSLCVAQRHRAEKPAPYVSRRDWNRPVCRTSGPLDMGPRGTQRWSASVPPRHSYPPPCNTDNLMEERAEVDGVGRIWTGGCARGARFWRVARGAV